jgi:selenocysteine lyase/cysteine desulfurase
MQETRIISRKAFTPGPMAQPPLTPVEALAELERGVHAALETYANVHRGSGHASMISTALFEQARHIVLKHLGFNPDRYTAIFCTPHRARQLEVRLRPGCYRSLSSHALGLPLGARALVVENRALPKGTPFQTGGGTARLVSSRWAIWAGAPDRFEAGTPAIINLIAWAKALLLSRVAGREFFAKAAAQELAVSQAPSVADVLYHDQLDAYSGRELLDKLRETCLDRHIHVPTAAGAQPFINLDNAASPPTFAPIWEAVRQAWRLPAPEQHKLIREVRTVCARFLGAPLADYEVIFTSNTTEALNLAAESLGRDCTSTAQPVVVNSELEHNSNELPWRSVRGVTLVRLPIDAEGSLNLAELEKRLRAYNRGGKHGPRRIRLVSVSGASNVLGEFSDLAAMGRLAHHYGARLLVDAAQLVAHRPVDMQGSGIDYLAFSAHKAYAPFGSGALVVRKGLLNFSSAELEQIQASGEENVSGIAALGKALGLLQRIGWDIIEEHERILTRRALEGLAAIPDLEVFGIQSPASPHFSQKGSVITFGLQHVPHNLVAQELAERGGIGVRSGCFCAHLLIKRLLNMHPLRARLADLALLLAPRFASLVQTGLVRVSLGLENDLADVDALVHQLDQIARQPRAAIDRQIAALHGGTLLPHTHIQQQVHAFTLMTVQRIYFSAGGDHTPLRPISAGSEYFGSEATEQPAL